jgi:hypothetical protein
MKNLFSIIAIVFSLNSYSQSLTKREIYNLDSIILHYLQSADTLDVYHESRKSSMVLITLETNLAGKVSNIKLLVDAGNIDSSYKILKKITPEDFRNWKSKSAKQKTLIIPFFTLGYGEYIDRGANPNSDKYVDQIFGDLIRGTQQPKIIHENGRTILLNPVSYSTFATTHFYPEKGKTVPKQKDY